MTQESKAELEAFVERFTAQVEINSSDKRAWFNLGLARHMLGELDEAKKSYGKAIEIDSLYLEPVLNLSGLYFESGKLSKATKVINASLSVSPNSPKLLHQMAMVHKKAGKPKLAITTYKKLIDLSPGDNIAHHKLAQLYYEEGKFELALGQVRAATSLKPKEPNYWFSLGNVLFRLKRFGLAEEAYLKAVDLDSDKGMYWRELAITQRRLGEMKLALGSAEKAIELDPGEIKSHYYKGLILEVQKKYGLAKAEFEWVLARNGEHVGACVHLCRCCQWLCDWEGLAKWQRLEKKLVLKQIEEGATPDLLPFMALVRYREAGFIKRVTRGWVEAQRRALDSRFKIYDSRMRTKKPSKPTSLSMTNRRIRLGYVSRDFYDHPVGQLVAGLFERHDRERFETYVFSYAPEKKDYYNARARKGADKFFDLFEKSTEETIKIIEDAKVDILIDLMGHTVGARPEVFLAKPAGLQIAWLGYPGSTQMDQMDYLVADKTVVSKTNRKSFSEKIIYLPDSYQVNSVEFAKPKKGYTRKDFGLSESMFVMAAFNQLYKIEPKLFETWMEILREKPDAYLWLIAQHSEAVENLRKQAAQHGVDPKRLVFSGGLLKPAHLVRIELADLALDTKLVNGHTSTSDALQAGVPVVTLQGKEFVSRVASSLLLSCGLGDLVTGSLEEYRELVLRLIDNPKLLRKYRSKLADKSKLKLFDADVFTRNLEKGYEVVWGRYVNGVQVGDVVVGT